ncbi:MAG TPA: hypothetical protein DEP51_02225 [Clostridiales bacterium]|nr:hypothetical protein [Clostridiales bacterium]
MNIFEIFKPIFNRFFGTTGTTPKLLPSSAPTRKGSLGKIRAIVKGPNMEDDYESCYEDYQTLLERFNDLYDLMFLHLKAGIIVKDEYNSPSHEEIQNAREDWVTQDKYTNATFELTKRQFFYEKLGEFFDKQDSQDEKTQYEKTQSDKYVEELINIMQQMNKKCGELYGIQYVAYKHSETTEETRDKQHNIAEDISDGINLNRLYQYLADNAGNGKQEEFLQGIDIPSSEEIKINNLILPPLINSFNSTVDKYSKHIEHGGKPLNLDVIQEKKPISIPEEMSIKQDDELLKLAQQIIVKERQDAITQD